jgi:lipid A 4'-phosphatase
MDRRMAAPNDGERPTGGLSPAKGAHLRRISEDRYVLSAIAATLVVSLLAVALQGYDVRISAVFYEPGQGFPDSKVPALLALRWLGRVVPGVVISAFAVLAVGRLMRGRPWPALHDRTLVFLTLCWALAPGLLVNLVLKTHWGRSRPIATRDFGGNAPFTPAWWPWGECQANCSFVSGEASTAMVMIAFVFVSPERWRPAIVAGTLLWTAVISLNRVAFGAHYFSDVVISCGLTLIIVFALKALVLDRHAD